MTADKQREIVIEFEKVQLIRKRARTQLAQCRGCATATDAVNLKHAAELFETELDALFRFITQNDCHYYIGKDQNVYLCVPSLLKHMHDMHNIRELAAGGEEK